MEASGGSRRMASAMPNIDVAKTSAAVRAEGYDGFAAQVCVVLEWL
jgi:hypothetical protein